MIRNPNPTPNNEDRPDVRKKGRIRCNSLTSSLGEVVDLSAGGVRIQLKGKVHFDIEQHLEITLQSESLNVPLRARVVWIRKTGFRTHEVGMAFEDMNDSLERQVNYLAREAMNRESMRESA